ncbi:hypothetical protein MW887_001715 [Aspergillus wentii]|nr:hypothetical protein MW887_001715 [Aspergillus wentii]
MTWKESEAKHSAECVPSSVNIVAHEMEKIPDGDNVNSQEIDSMDKQDPFGDESDAAMKYKTMAWWQAGMIMIAETISLGILSLPKALSILGLLPGVLVIIIVGILTSYTGFTIGQLKRRYVQIHTMADAGEILFGGIGRTTLGTAQLTFFVFVMGSHILTFSIMMNVLTDHSACTMAFSFSGLIISLVLTLPRRLENLSQLSSVSFVSIIGAVFTSMVGVSLANQAPKHVPLFSPAPTVHDACLAVANIVFAYAGHVAFFTLFSELRDINDYPKALAFLQASEMVLYTVTSIVIYAFVGPTITSPALNSAGRLFRKISYAIAIPTIVIAGVVNAHVAVKFLYVRIFRGTNAMHTTSFMARSTWAIQSSLFASWFSFGLPGIFWLHMNKHYWFHGWKQKILFGLNVGIVVIGLVTCVFGFYSSIKSIHENLVDGVSGGSFSCADNS